MNKKSIRNIIIFLSIACVLVVSLIIVSKYSDALNFNSYRDNKNSNSNNNLNNVYLDGNYKANLIFLDTSLNNKSFYECDEEIIKDVNINDGIINFGDKEFDEKIEACEIDENYFYNLKDEEIINEFNFPNTIYYCTDNENYYSHDNLKRTYSLIMSKNNKLYLFIEVLDKKLIRHYVNSIYELRDVNDLNNLQNIKITDDDGYLKNKINEENLKLRRGSKLCLFLEANPYGHCDVYVNGELSTVKIKHAKDNVNCLFLDVLDTDMNITIKPVYIISRLDYSKKMLDYNNENIILYAYLEEYVKNTSIKYDINKYRFVFSNCDLSCKRLEDYQRNLSIGLNETKELIDNLRAEDKELVNKIEIIYVSFPPTENQIIREYNREENEELAKLYKLLYIKYDKANIKNVFLKPAQENGYKKEEFTQLLANDDIVKGKSFTVFKNYILNYDSSKYNLFAYTVLIESKVHFIVLYNGIFYDLGGTAELYNDYGYFHFGITDVNNDGFYEILISFGYSYKANNINSGSNYVAIIDEYSKEMITLNEIKDEFVFFKETDNKVCLYSCDMKTYTKTDIDKAYHLITKLIKNDYEFNFSNLSNGTGEIEFYVNIDIEEVNVGFPVIPEYESNLYFQSFKVKFSGTYNGKDMDIFADKDNYNIFTVIYKNTNNTFNLYPKNYHSDSGERILYEIRHGQEFSGEYEFIITNKNTLDRMVGENQIVAIIEPTGMMYNINNFLKIKKNVYYK